LTKRRYLPAEARSSTILHDLHYFVKIMKFRYIAYTGRQGDYKVVATYQRDRGAVSAFIERFAVALTEAGFPRMPARVFAGLLATDSGRLTAADLADLLQISPAAVSGSVRYLAQVNLASREREPGSRRDYYRVDDDVWYEAIARRDQVLARWERSVRDGIEVLGGQTPAGTRMAEMLAFFEFMQRELPPLLKKWREHKLKMKPNGAKSPIAVDAQSAKRIRGASNRRRMVSS
jgi:predicted transcriptional regulator